jgi:phosphatidylinositol glycan class B
MTTTLSLISHKEVRFLYPLLPFLHILAASPLAQFLPSRASLPRKATIFLLLTANLLLAFYASQFHQRGVIDVLSHLRQKHESRNNLSLSIPDSHVTNTTVAFLMPCHSTPWRSHLIHPHISAWALTCEPPLHIPLAARDTYLDEADAFYINPGPKVWLEKNMQDVQSITYSGSRSGQYWRNVDPGFQSEGKRMWPGHLVFFGALEDTLKEVLGNTRYRECWRGFNSHFHDDGRRVGDVVVWCLDGK